MKQNNIIFGICLITIGFLLALILKVTIMVDFERVELTKYDGVIKVQCGSDSMGLTFGCDDLLYYRDVKKNEELVLGDIYIYIKEDGGKTVHRLIECVDIDCNLTVFKGDNNAVGELVNKSNVIRKIEGVRYR